MIGLSLAPPSDLMPPASLMSSTASLVAFTIISPTVALGPDGEGCDDRDVDCLGASL